MNLEQQAARTIARYDMLRPGQPVLAALSGGADSVALVYVLCALGYPVRAYHLNHCLRGEESERDADFVHSLCIMELVHRKLSTGFAQQVITVCRERDITERLQPARHVRRSRQHTCHFRAVERLQQIKKSAAFCNRR